ncbi:MAG: B12-binding domain-containing radical SAM protein, partial [Lachnospiraceae bacterium]|nr:B12-binding domain-containing radical SAM protein [Lachnospiraceae bacterium]
MTNKRIILVGINAKYIHSNPAVYSLKTYADTYYSDCSVLDGNSKITDNLTISEYTINQSLDSILADLYNQKPDVVAFSCYIWNWNMVRDILDELPKIMPKTDIWLGGPEVSFNADKLVNQYPAIKGIMVGEGEETFLELLKYYWEAADRFQNLSDIKGIVLKEGFTGERELTNIDKLPFIYNNNTDFTDKFKNRIIYYESQRGCPFRCSYCLSSIDKSVRLRDLETVKKELKFFLDNKVDQVKFIDRTFNCNNEHALSIWRFLKENDNGITNFHFEIAADLLSTQQLEIISQMRPGLIQLEIGVQSTNEKTLKAINRHMDIEQLKSTVQKVHGYKNTHQHLDLIAGLPYEDYNSFASSFNEVYKMQPNQLQLGFLKVLNGSPMKEKAEEYG